MRAIDAIDLNLVTVFDAVMRCRSVSRAGRMLGVTPSAVSHALGRLRRTLGDDLFVPTEAGMLPTPRAIAIYPDLREGLERIAAALGPLDPAPRREPLRLAASDCGASVVLPLMLDQFAESTDTQMLDIVRADGARAMAMVENGDVHGALGSFAIVSNRLRRNLVQADELVVAVRHGHDLATARERSRTLVALAQSIIDAMARLRDQAGDPTPSSPSAHPIVFDPARVMQCGQDHRSLLRLARSVPFPSGVAAFLHDTDLAAILPRRLVARTDGAPGTMLAAFGLSRPLPLELVWLQDSDRQGHLTWLLGEIARRGETAVGEAA